MSDSCRSGHSGWGCRFRRCADEGRPPRRVRDRRRALPDLDLPFIAPELREGADEIAAAERGILPHLISDGHIRGDLHMHSTWSDGRDTIEDMVIASRQLGYEYIAITDHSERAWSSRRLPAGDIPDQRAGDRELRASVPRHRDPARRRSRHHARRQPRLRRRPARRLRHRARVAARPRRPRRRAADREVPARHPPSAGQRHHAPRQPVAGPIQRLPARLRSAVCRRGRDRHRDGDRRRARATSTWTASSPAGPLPRGVTLVIDSDCHRAEALARQMQFGIGTARRGWIEPRARAEHPQRRRRPGVRRAQARAWLTGSPSPASSPPSRSGRIRRRCCRVWTSATPAASRQPCSGRKSAPGRRTRCITTSRSRSSWRPAARGFSRTGCDPARALNLFSAIWAAAAVGLLAFLPPRSPIARRRRIAGGLPRILLHVLDAGDHRGGLHAAPGADRRCASSRCTRTRARPTTPRLAMFFALYAVVVRQPLVDDSAARAVCRLPASDDTRPPRACSARDRRARDACGRRSGRCSTGRICCRSSTAPDAPADWSTAPRHSGSTRPRPTGATRWCSASGPARPPIGSPCGGSTPRQQFGVARPRARAWRALVRLWRMSRRWAVLVLTAFAIKTAFALTYNVGDSHVFFLPAHFLTAFCAGAAVAGPARACTARAADRKDPRSWIRTALASRRHLVLRVAWMVHVACRRSPRRSARRATDRAADARHQRPGCAARLGDELAARERPALPRTPPPSGPHVDAAWRRDGALALLVADNHEIGRDIVLTAEAAAEVVGSVRTPFPLVRRMTPSPAVSRSAEVAAASPPERPM